MGQSLRNSESFRVIDRLKERERWAGHSIMWLGEECEKDSVFCTIGKSFQ